MEGEEKIRVTMVDGIKVTVIGEISDYNLKLYNERLAIALLKQYGPEFCRELLNLMESKEK